MYLGLAASVIEDSPRILSEDQLRNLARTFDRSVSPVWVEDPAGGCLYSNRAAGSDAGPESSAAFDILDHSNRVVARLRTARR